MSWNEEKRKNLFEDYKLGKITTEEFDEKVDILDKLSDNKVQNNTDRISKRRIILSIVLILTVITSYYLLGKAYTYFSSRESAAKLDNPKETIVLQDEKLKNKKALSGQSEISVPNAGSTFIILSDSEFIELCKKGSFQQINDAISNRANVNARDKGWTPLMAAAGNNSDPEIITALIKAGADVNATNVLGRTPLLMAAGNNSIPEVIKVLIDSGADVNPKTDGNTPLMEAAGDNPNPKAITALIKAGADANATNVSGRTPLLLAAKSSSSPEAIKILIDASSDVNMKDIDGKTPLIVAAESRNINPEIITALIKAGGDVNERDKFGLTPLMLAAGNDNSSAEVITAIVKTETSHGKASVKVNAQDENGKTPLMESAHKNSNPKVITTLLQLGANPRVKDDLGKTAIDYARQNRRLSNADVLQKLQSKEYNVPLKASDSPRAAMSDYSFLELCKNGSIQRIKKAIKNGANVNARNSVGETPLLLAAGNNSNPEVISVLINAGADANAKNNKGDTAVEYARGNKSQNIYVVRNLGNKTTVMLTGSTNSSINDSRFIELCSSGSFQQIYEAIYNGANVNAKSDGITPLIAAVSNKDYRAEVIRILVASGANVNTKGNNGKTPLMAAAQYGTNPEVITALLNYGAHSRMRDNNDRMAINYALDNKYLKNTQAVQRLAHESNYWIPAENATGQNVYRRSAPGGIPIREIVPKQIDNREKTQVHRRPVKKIKRYYDYPLRKSKD